MKSDSVSFAGVITATTPDGRSGVVVLTEPCQGREYAVISTETKGRVALMNGSGRLQKATWVKGRAAVGSQSLMAIDVERDGRQAREDGPPKDGFRKDGPCADGRAKTGHAETGPAKTGHAKTGHAKTDLATS